MRDTLIAVLEFSTLSWNTAGDLSTIIKQANRRHHLALSPKFAKRRTIAITPLIISHQRVGLRLMVTPSTWKDAPDELEFYIAILNQTMVRPHTL
jgi:hypothetical protein